MTKKMTLKKYRQLVEKQAQAMLDSLAFAATGDLSVEIEIPEGVDVLTDLAIGFSYLLDDMRELLAEQARTNEELEQRVTERTQELERALAEVQTVQRRYVQEQWQQYAMADSLPKPDPIWLPAMAEAIETQTTTRYGNGNNETALALPIRYSDELIGVLGIQDDEALAWDDEDITAVEAVIEQVGLALENQRLFDQTQAALAETESLYKAGAAINTAQTYDELLDALRVHTLVGHGTTNVSLNYFETAVATSETPEWADVLAFWNDQNTGTNLVGTRYPVPDILIQLGVLTSSQPVIIEDVTTDPRLTEEIRELYTKQYNMATSVFIPLVVSQQVVGYVNANYAQPTRFTEEEIRQIALLAGQAAVVAQTIRLLQETQTLLESEQRQRLTANRLVQTAERMTGVLDEQKIRHILLDSINDLIRPDQISLYEWSEAEACLRLAHRLLAAPEHAEDAYELDHLIPSTARPDLWDVFYNNQPLLEAAQQTNEFYREHYCLPWLVNGQPVGIIEAYHTARGVTIRDVDQRAAEDMVRQADLRIQNARLFGQSRRRADELAILNEMGRTLTVTREVETVVENIYTYTNRLTDAQNFYVALYNKDSNEISFPLARQQGEVIELATRPFSQGATEYVIQSGQPLLIQDGVAKWLQAQGFADPGAIAESWLGVPLRIGNEVLGAIAIRSDRPYVYDVDHQNVLVSIASQASIAIQNARLFAQTQQQLANITTIQQTTSSLTAANSLDDAVQTLLSQVATAVQADTASMYLIEGEHLTRIGAFPQSESEGGRMAVPLSHYPLVQEVLQTRQAVAISLNDSNLQEYAQQSLTDADIVANATVPLNSREGVIGTLAISSRQEGHNFSSSDLSLLQTLADQATIAIERVRLLEATRQRARREQLLREITGRVRGSADIDTIMKTAVQEIGRALGRETFIQLGNEGAT